MLEDFLLGLIWSAAHHEALYTTRRMGEPFFHHNKNLVLSYLRRRGR